GTISFITYTDATGTASATWTLGVEGLTQTARASVSMLADSSPGRSPPVIFTATANGAATELVDIAGNGQVAIIDDTLPVPRRVRRLRQRHDLALQRVVVGGARQRYHQVPLGRLGQLAKRRVRRGRQRDDLALRWVKLESTAGSAHHRRLG